MAAEAVQPLRINKSATSSPSKMPRPLSEINPTERRRNSPSYNQAINKMAVSRESSPFDISPFSNSLRSFWQGRDPASPSRLGSENPSDRESSPSPGQRSSIENLKKASRVKNSNMFAREHQYEYDPKTTPVVERPLAGRPFSAQLQNNTFTRFDSVRKENSPLKGPDFKGHRRTESHNKIPVFSPLKSPAKEPLPASPVKDLYSPNKSSLTSNSRFGAAGQVSDNENSMWSEDEKEIDDEHRSPTPRFLHRHAKSVTFDTAPPEINEYEMQTPDPSSIASGSREGSFESTEDLNEDESFDRGSSANDDDSFDASLEDTDKTPVVLPEDWQRMSPDAANMALVDQLDDVFDSTEANVLPNTAPSTPNMERPMFSRADSTTSDGEPRPLPPLPASQAASARKSRRDSTGLTAAAERASSAQRSLPSPPRPASVSKLDILRMRESSVSLDDRLRLMSDQATDKEENESPQQSEKAERRASFMLKHLSSKTESSIETHEDPVEDDELTALGEYVAPPRISRESILRKVRSNHFDDVEYDYSSPAGSEHSSPERSTIDYGSLDPDVPIPSREASSDFDVQLARVTIKQEDDDRSEVDVYSIPDLYRDKVQDRSCSRMDDHERESSVVHHKIVGGNQDGDDDDASRYSSAEPFAEAHQQELSKDLTDNEGPPTPRPQDYAIPRPAFADLEKKEQNRMSLPDFDDILGSDNFNLGLRSYMSPSPPESAETMSSLMAVPKLEPATQLFSGPITPDEPLEPPRSPGSDNDEPGTPNSVIRHSVAGESPGIPEPVATIKTGGKLKTRPSLTPVDAQAMASARRQASGEHPPPVPSKERHIRPSYEGNGYGSMDGDEESAYESATESAGSGETKADSLVDSDSKREMRRVSMKMKLDIPVSDFSEGLGFGLDEEFDRLMEAQKVAYPPPAHACFPPTPQPISALPSSPSFESPYGAEYVGLTQFSPQRRETNYYIPTQKGYLMRQNTKVVVASNRKFSEENEPPLMSPAAETPAMPAKGTRSAGNSPRKSSNERFMTTEPWNGKARRRSVRLSSGNKQRVNMGPAPPLPGQESALGTVVEDSSMQPLDDFEDGAERGRLFVKVVGVKDLDLPLPRNERTSFQLTLDNGLHCVTTASLELGRTAPIGQEFELVVLSDLEFQLTLQTKLKKPPPPPMPVDTSPVKAVSPQKKSAFSRLLSSPKKRKEQERKQQEELEKAERRRQEEIQRKRASVPPTAWDLLHELVAPDGSFARAYVSLKNHERQAFGKQFNVDVPCFNEWALEKDPGVMNSVKSKRGGIARKPPYKIANLQLQLLYVPKPKGATDEDMPKSMTSAIREIKEAREVKETVWEGYLSQQGGDCPFWRRRFFKLSGPKFTGYHETTRQPRATINLSKASKLIDDKRSLMDQPSVNGKSGGRRKSAFAEEEDGYMFVEEGFRIRFANGETIDFYADNAADKEGWMRALSEVVGKEAPGKGKGWTALIIAKERAEASKAERMVSAQSNAPSQHSIPRKPSATSSQQVRPASSGRVGSQSAPNSPMKPTSGNAMKELPSKLEGTPPMAARKSHRERDQVRSMIF
ncbi:GTP binding protein-like protein Bud4 [Cryomyces antarcticus]